MLVAALVTPTGWVEPMYELEVRTGKSVLTAQPLVNGNRAEPCDCHKLKQKEK